LVPPLDRQLVAPLSETKNWWKFEIANEFRQIALGQTRHYIVIFAYYQKMLTREQLETACQGRPPMNSHGTLNG
jgi:hypothetical protein